jgi:hypothetical protein
MTLIKLAPLALAGAKRLIGYRDAERARRAGAGDFQKLGARSVSMDDQTAELLPCD